MARNKHPEETKQRIMEIAFRLFMEQGYEHTTIQDIVDALGMSKGAIYHHFKTKEEILNELTESNIGEVDWFSGILNDKSLNGLQKLKRLFYIQLSDEKKLAMDKVMLPILKNPRVVANQIGDAVENIAPMFAKILRIGIEDGSITTDYPDEAAQVLILLANLWINPGLFPVEKDAFMRKIAFYGRLCDSIGIPLIDDTLIAVCSDYYDTTRPAVKKA